MSVSKKTKKPILSLVGDNKWEINPTFYKCGRESWIGEIIGLDVHTTGVRLYRRWFLDPEFTEHGVYVSLKVGSLYEIKVLDDSLGFYIIEETGQVKKISHPKAQAIAAEKSRLATLIFTPDDLSFIQSYLEGKNNAPIHFSSEEESILSFMRSNGGEICWSVLRALSLLHPANPVIHAFGYNSIQYERFPCSSYYIKSAAPRPKQLYEMFSPIPLSRVVLIILVSNIWQENKYFWMDSWKIPRMNFFQAMVDPTPFLLQEKRILPI